MAAGKVGDCSRRRIVTVKRPVEARDLRSLDRRSMYSIFAPLDPNERLPRELLLERPPRLGISLLARRRRRLRRWELAAAISLPALFLLLAAAGAVELNGMITGGLVALLAFGLIIFGLSGRGVEKE
jgi:hypothetical protein